MPELWLPFLLIMVSAAFITGMVGFGSALLAMPLLINLLGLQDAAATFSLASIPQGLLMVALYRRNFHFKTVWRIVLPSWLMIPLGVIGATLLPEAMMLVLLGLIILGYALYNLFGFRLPRLKNVNWAFPFGMAGGLLAGAYNTAGPPLIIYADMIQWERDTFKANLPAVFMCNHFVATASHVVAGNHSADTLLLALMAVPAVLTGILAGKSMDRVIDTTHFRKIVLVLLLIISVRLLYTTLS